MKRGNRAPCKAKKGNCPFGGADLHFTSNEAAREAYEFIAAVERAKALGAWKRKPKITEPEPPVRKRSHPNSRSVPYQNPYSPGGGHGRHGMPLNPRTQGHGYSGHGR